MSTYRMSMSPGVLAVDNVRKLFDEEKIEPRHSPRPNFEKMDGSAFDIPIGRAAWKLDHGQRPTTRELQKLKDRATPVKLEQDQDGEFFLLKKGEIYLIELDYNLHLPSNINGRATGKSSIGRLDVITRLLTADCREYDVVEAGYHGALHLLVVPQTFSIKVAPGKSLNQLRLFCGPPYASVITRHVIGNYGTEFWHVPSVHPGAGNPFEPWDEVVKKYSDSQTADPTLFDLTVELADPAFPYIFKALSGEREPIDLRKGEKSHDPKVYFEQTKIDRSAPSPSVVLEHGGFYIMKSKERLYIPPDVAVEVVAISERIGDIRIHYAGFAHPGFGRHGDHTKPGTPLIFEVRATDMITRLYDGSLLARIQLFRMADRTKISASAYDKQELKLSQVFRDWLGEQR